MDPVVAAIQEGFECFEKALGLIDQNVMPCIRDFDHLSRWKL